MIYIHIKTSAKEVMSKRFIILNENHKLDYAIEKMITNNLTETFVNNNEEKLIGILTLTDISKIKRKGLKLDVPIKNYMITDLITIEKECPLKECRNIMRENRIARLPVIEKGKLIGVIRVEEIRDYFYMKLEENSTKMMHLINNIHEAACSIDKEGTVVLWNKSAEDLYGVSAEEILGKKLKDFFPDAIMLKILEDKKPINNMYHSPRKDSYVIISAHPIYINNEFVGVVSTDRDVTEVKELSYQLEKANTTLKFLEDEVKRYSNEDFKNIIGKSDKVVEKIKIAKQVAKTETSILITGESGTGKEVFARAVHEHSNRKGLFVPVNCSAIPNELFESELFGYEEGAFTGAKKKGKVGIFELANDGTIFLDEIGDMPLNMQAKLLRALQEKEIRRVGGEKSISVNVRVISATNRDLKTMVKEGKFREDLYYRLNVVELKLPPLRERNGDVVLLTNYFLNEICKKSNRKIPQIEQDVINILQGYDWPGNIRELKNTVEYLLVMCKNNIIKKDIIPAHILEKTSKPIVEDDYPLDINLATKKLEINIIKKALKMTQNNKAKAAKLLNIPRSTLYYKIENYGIEVEEQ